MRLAPLPVHVIGKAESRDKRPSAERCAGMLPARSVAVVMAESGTWTRRGVEEGPALSTRACEMGSRNTAGETIPDLDDT